MNCLCKLRTNCAEHTSRKAAVVSILLFTTVLLLASTAGCKNRDLPLFTYVKLESGTIQITGLTAAGKECSDVVIPATVDNTSVSGIAREAFRDCGNLKSVTIEDGIKEIGENAFLNCYNLESITFPESINTVGTNAFVSTLWLNNSLENEKMAKVNDILVAVRADSSEYKVPDGIKVIASGTFYNNDTVEKILLPESLEIIDKFAMAECDNLTEVIVPNSVCEIGYGAFDNSVQLKVTVSGNLKKIGTDAFKNVAEVIYK